MSAHAGPGVDEGRWPHDRVGGMPEADDEAEGFDWHGDEHFDDGRFDAYDDDDLPWPDERYENYDDWR